MIAEVFNAKCERPVFKNALSCKHKSLTYGGNRFFFANPFGRCADRLDEPRTNARRGWNGIGKEQKAVGRGGGRFKHRQGKLVESGSSTNQASDGKLGLQVTFLFL